MKTQTITALVFAAGFLTTAAFADNSTTAPAATTVAAQSPAPNQIIYVPQLPSVAELTSAAAAQGVTVRQITQSARQVNITAQTADGRTKVVSYQLLADAGTNLSQVVAPSVVYVATSSRDYYYDPYYYPYYPGYVYPPVSVQLGLGFRIGGFRGGRRW